MQFETGKTYAARSIVGKTIIKVRFAQRTATTITTTSGRVLAITDEAGVEQVRPWGSDSWAPIVSADREA